MTNMKTVSVTEFKAHCLELLNLVHRTRQPLLLTKRGKPTAMVGPAPSDSGNTWVPGQFKDKGKIKGVLLEPFEDRREATP